MVHTFLHKNGKYQGKDYPGCPIESARLCSGLINNNNSPRKERQCRYAKAHQHMYYCVPHKEINLMAKMAMLE